MTVTVRLFAAAAEAAGADERTIGAGPLSDVLEAVGAAAPDRDRWESVLGRCSVLVDGLLASDYGAAAVSPGSTVDVLPPFAGG
ncbi:MAG: MoaD/ThiS family protein [Actinobacteria bacterium]|nr:MAG: MoaD/ThiS family protein [Actinomycetota bacterium]